MKRLHQDIVLILVGVFVLAGVLKGVHLHVVKESLTPWLALSGFILVGLGTWGLTVERLIGRSGPSHRTTRTGWVFALPFVLLALVPPAPLGSYAASRDTAPARTFSAELQALQQLPAGEVVTMSMSEFVGRSQLEGAATMAGRRFRLVGFVSLADPAQPEGGWFLTRMAVSCCAADGYAVRVQLRGAPAHPVDTWLEVTGQWIPETVTHHEAPIPVLVVDQVRTVPQPAQPYDS